MVREIKLTKGAVALVDDEDYRHLSIHKWHLTSNGYAARRAIVGGKSKIVLMHQYVTELKYGEMPDHIDMNKLNNSRKNIRPVTRSQNRMNGGLDKNNKSGVRGVSWDTGRQLWTSKIGVNGKTINLGRFNDIVVASRAYKSAVEKYFPGFSTMGKTPH